MATCEGCGSEAEFTYMSCGKGHDCYGATICRRCAGAEVTRQTLENNIRARRAAQAEQPKDADGVVIRVGDYLYIGGDATYLVERIVDESHVDVQDVERGSRFKAQDSSQFKHKKLPAPQQQGEASPFKVGDMVTHGGDDRWQVEAVHPDEKYKFLYDVVGLHERHIKFAGQCLSGAVLAAPAPSKTTGGGTADKPTRQEEQAQQAPPVDSLHFGPDVYPANPAYAIAAEREPPVVDVAASPLAAFTAAVEKHLVPRLPNGLRVVTDLSHGGYGYTLSGPMVALWVLDDAGKELYCEAQPRPSKFDLEEAAGIAATVASALMAEKARGK